jgi:hypothetical protein
MVSQDYRRVMESKEHSPAGLHWSGRPRQLQPGDGGVVLSSWGEIAHHSGFGVGQVGESGQTWGRLVSGDITKHLESSRDPQYLVLW